MNIEEYVASKSPFVLKCFYREQKNSWEDLKKGSIVMSLRSGFGGGPGIVMTVASKTADVATLRHDGSDYILYRRNDRDGDGDWNCVVYLFESKAELEPYKKLNMREQRQWQLENIGKKLY